MRKEELAVYLAKLSGHVTQPVPRPSGAPEVRGPFTLAGWLFPYQLFIADNQDLITTGLGVFPVRSG